MLHESRLLDAMERISSFLGWAYSLFGDLAYPNGPYLQRPFDLADGGSWEVAVSSLFSFPLNPSPKCALDLVIPGTLQP